MASPGIGNTCGRKAEVLAQDPATAICLISVHVILVSTHLVVTNGQPDTLFCIRSTSPTKYILHGPNIIPILQQMRRKNFIYSHQLFDKFNKRLDDTTNVMQVVKEYNLGSQEMTGTVL